MFHATAPGAAHRPTLRALGDLEPTTLAIMHGSSFQGDGKRALYDLARYDSQALTRLSR